MDGPDEVSLFAVLEDLETQRRQLANRAAETREWIESRLAADGDDAIKAIALLLSLQESQIELAHERISLLARAVGGVTAAAHDHPEV